MFTARCSSCRVLTKKAGRENLSRATKSSHRCYVTLLGGCNTSLGRNQPRRIGAPQEVCVVQLFNNLERTELVSTQKRFFQSVGEYHKVADETLDAIQDAIEDMIDEVPGMDDVEVTVASGVLTLSIPGHGTWVINKQTPNEQIWWSSPLSGPRRYEYNAKTGHWVYTRSQPGDEKHEETLGTALVQEMKQLLDLDLDLEV